METQHSYCPDGPDTWCKYKQDIINCTNTNYREKCLPPVFRSELLPIFKHLSSTDLLASCSKGLTQTQNEVLNNVADKISVDSGGSRLGIWGLIPSQ